MPDQPPYTDESDEPTKDESLTQAEVILARFGGARNLMRILAEIGRPRNPSTIYKWTYPKEIGGSGGLIPTAAWDDILAAARAEGLVFTAEEIDPRCGTQRIRTRLFKAIPHGVYRDPKTIPKEKRKPGPPKGYKFPPRALKK